METMNISTPEPVLIVIKTVLRGQTFEVFEDRTANSSFRIFILRVSLVSWLSSLFTLLPSPVKIASHLWNCC